MNAKEESKEEKTSKIDRKGLEDRMYGSLPFHANSSWARALVDDGESLYYVAGIERRLPPLES